MPLQVLCPNWFLNALAASAVPFFSVDVATRADGILRVVEIGDGQVSDLVGWESARFAELWKA